MKPTPNIKPPSLRPPTSRCFIQMMAPTAIRKAKIEPTSGHGLGDEMIIVIRLGVSVGHVHSSSSRLRDRSFVPQRRIAPVEQLAGVASWPPGRLVRAGWVSASGGAKNV